MNKINNGGSRGGGEVMKKTDFTVEVNPFEATDAKEYEGFTNKR